MPGGGKRLAANSTNSDAACRSDCPNGGFLTPQQWKGAIEAAGFADTRFVPDVMRIHRAVSDFFVAAIGAIRPD